MIRRYPVFRLCAALAILFLAATAASEAWADPARRRRRRAPTTGDSSSQVQKPSQAKPSSGGPQSLDDQIAQAKARIRAHRRKLADTVKAAGLSGTALYAPGGVKAGKAFGYSSTHAGKKVRGQVKAGRSGPSADATITASKAR